MPERPVEEMSTTEIMRELADQLQDWGLIEVVPHGFPTPDLPPEGQTLSRQEENDE